MHKRCDSDTRPSVRLCGRFGGAFSGAHLKQYNYTAPKYIPSESSRMDGLFRANLGWLSLSGAVAQNITLMQVALSVAESLGDP